MSTAVLPLLSILTVLASAPDGGLAPPIELRARVTAEKVQLGEPFTLEVMVTHDPQQRYELKAPGELEDFEYLHQERKRLDGADRSTTTILVQLSAFKLGTLDTPALELEVSAAEGVATLPVPMAKVEVVSSLPPDADQNGANLYDVKAPEEVAIRSWRLLWGLAAALGLGLLAWAVVKYLRRPRPVAPVYVPPPEPGHVRARKALDALAAENLPLQGQFKPYYFRLSEILRGYLGELYGFEALECTTPELIAALHARTTPGLPVAEVKTFAEASDFVRYAKQEPTVEQCKEHLELGYRIIHSTQGAPPTRASTP